MAADEILTPADLTKIKARYEAATPGKWVVSVDESEGSLYHLIEPAFWNGRCPKDWAAEDMANARFMRVCP